MDKNIEQLNDWDKLLQQEEDEYIARQKVIDKIEHMDEFQTLVKAIQESFDDEFKSFDDEFISSNISEDDAQNILEEYLYYKNNSNPLKKLPLDYSADKLIRGLIYKKKDIDKFKQRFNSYNQQLILESMNYEEEFNYKLMDQINKKTYLLDKEKRKNNEWIYGQIEKQYIRKIYY